jgi:hypothetical protein
MEEDYGKRLLTSGSLVQDHRTGTKASRATARFSFQPTI